MDKIIPTDFSEKKNYTDIEIVCEDDKILYFSKFVLTMTSEYFKRMFDGYFKEKDDKRIVIKKPSSLLNEVFNYLILRKISITPENIENLYMIAEEYLITDLITLCTEYLNKEYYNLDPVIILNLSILYEIEEIRNKIRCNCDMVFIRRIINSSNLGNLNYNFDKFIPERLKVDVLAIKFELLKRNKDFKDWFLTSDNSIFAIMGRNIKDKDYFSREDHSMDFECKIREIVMFYNDEKLNELYKEYNFTLFDSILEEYARENPGLRPSRRDDTKAPRDTDNEDFSE